MDNFFNLKREIETIIQKKTVEKNTFVANQIGIYLIIAIITEIYKLIYQFKLW